MTRLRVALGQINPVVGDLGGNADFSLFAKSPNQRAILISYKDTQRPASVESANTPDPVSRSVSSPRRSRPWDLTTAVNS